MNKINITTYSLRSASLPSPMISSRPSDHDFSTHFFAALALSKELSVRNEVGKAPSSEQVRLSTLDGTASNLDGKLMGNVIASTALDREMLCSYAADVKRELIVSVNEKNSGSAP